MKVLPEDDLICQYVHVYNNIEMCFIIFVHIVNKLKLVTMTTRYTLTGI